MLTIQKIDYYGQLILAALMILSIPFYYFYGFLYGLFIIGIWQLLSAVMNTTVFIHTVFRKRILIYWLCCFGDFVLLILGYYSDELFNIRDGYKVFGLAIILAIGIAVYYLIIYKKLIGSLSLRNELDGLTKSKH